MTVKTGRMKPKTGSDRWIQLLNDKLTRFDRPSRWSIFASNAGLCSRQTAGMMQLPDSMISENGPASQFYFSIGKAFEEVIREALISARILHVRELRIEDRIDPRVVPISGRIDFVIEDEDDRLVPIELKSCGKLPPSPKPAHLAQLMTYLVLTGCPRGILWYVSRSVADFSGNLQSVTFTIEPTDEERFEVAKEIALGAVARSVDVIPPIPTHMKSYKCGFCPLVPHCWKEEPVDLEGHNPSSVEWASVVEVATIIATEVAVLSAAERYEDFRNRFNEELGLKW